MSESQGQCRTSKDQNEQPSASNSQSEIVGKLGASTDENFPGSIQYSKSQMKLLEVEKEKTEKQLHEAHVSTPRLQGENKFIDRYRAVLTKQKKEASVAHTNEIALIRRTQFQEEREQLMNHMRKQKQEADMEIMNLEVSLLEDSRSLKLEHQGTVNTSQKDIENLKVELQTQQDVIEEMERSYGALIQDKNAFEIKACQLEIENAALRKEISHENGIAEVSQHKMRLQTAEKRISELEHDKINAVASAEQTASLKIINMQIKHEEDLNTTKRQLEEALATINAQEQRIQMIQSGTSANVMWKHTNPQGKVKIKVSPERKGNPLQQKTQEEDKSNLISNHHHLASPLSGKIISPSYFGGRWTAHRADCKKYTQEMLIITEALEAEGYGPNQATVDEVIRHLWWKKEHICGELQTAKQTLSKTLGKDHFQVVQEYREERLAAEKQLEETKEQLLSAKKETEAIQTCFQKKLAEVLTEKLSAVEKNNAMSQRLQLMEKENNDIKLSLQEQHKLLMEKKAQIMDTEKNLGTSVCEVSFAQRELARERQKTAHYQARVDSLSTRLATQNAELMKSMESHSLDKKKFETAEEHAQRAEEQIMLMKRKVNELEGELPLQKMQLSQVIKEKDSLQKQLDTLTVQLANSESQVDREKIKATTLQVKVDELEEELHTKTDQLLHAFSRQNELESEISSVRKEQHAALENAAKMESDLLLNHVALKSAKAELLHFQEMSKKLQNSVVTTQRELEVSHKELEVEKSTVTKLELSLENVKSQLESTSLEVTKTYQQLTDGEVVINDLKEEMNCLRVSKENIHGELQTRTAEMEIEKKRMEETHAELEMKRKELDTLQVQMEKLQCTLACETEKNSSIQIDLSMKEGDFNECQQQCTTLNDELMQLKQQHKETMEAQSSLISKLKSEIMLAEIQNKNLMQEIKSLKDSLMDEKDISSSLLDKLQSSEGSALTIKEELQSTLKQLANKTVAKESLETTLTQSQGRNQELNEHLVETQQEFKECIAQLDNARTELALTHSQLKSTTEQLEAVKGTLELEREEKVQIHADLKSSENAATALHQRIMHLEQDLVTRKESIKSLTDDLINSSKKYEELSRLLDETQQELFVQQEMGKEAQHNYTQMITTLKDQHADEATSLKQEKKSLEEELKKTRDHMMVVQEHLKLCETEASECTTKVSLMEQKCSQLEKEIDSKTSMCKSLQSHATRLESDNTESRLKLSDLSDKVAAQSEIIEQLKVDLGHSCRERDSLHEQIQLQRETATASINRMQNHHLEKCAELHKRIQEQAGKLKEAQLASKSSRQETANLKAEIHTLSLSVCEKEENLSLLRDQFREESTQLKLSQQKVSQLESALLEEQKCRKILQEGMSDEHTKRVEYEAIASEKEKQLQYVSQDLHQCKNFLAKEKTCTEKLRGDSNTLQTKIATTEAQLEAARESLRECKLKTESEVTCLRQKYHTERRTLKERVRELHSHLQTVKTQYDSRGEEISRLEGTNQTLTKNQHELSRKATETEQLLQCKADECKNLELKVQSLEIQTVQLQKELTSVKRVLVEVEEQKKKVEVRSRSDVKRVLAEVTGHMEQQYSNQRYLDKLRTDNEAMALLEKERQIGQLKTELKQKKQEVKQDRLQIERLTTESKHLQHQHREHECSRRRLEARLEQVNDTLSHTFPLPSRSPSGSLSNHPTKPLQSSTPISRSYKKY